MSNQPSPGRRIRFQSRRSNLSDLELVQYGTEACLPGHSFGPAVRDHWLIHCVLDGKGRFESDGRKWPLEKGDGFLICPDQVTWYGADWETPWKYAWVGFTGSRAAEALAAAGLDMETPVFRDPSFRIGELLMQWNRLDGFGPGQDLRLLGYLYGFLAELAETAGHTAGSTSRDNGRRAAYVKKAIDFYRMYYARSVGVSDAAAHLGLDRSYFSEIFREETGTSPRDYLIRLRLDKACRFMRNPVLSIADIARSVGYEDPLRFSKLFRKHLGLSPRQYKRQIRQEPPNPDDQASGSENPNPSSSR